jgi:hypothetical protein
MNRKENEDEQEGFKKRRREARSNDKESKSTWGYN